MLFGDRAKYAMLLGGLAFSALPMTQQVTVFFGLLSWTSSHMRNMQAKLWVFAPKVEQVNEFKPFRGTGVGRVRSVSAVVWAVPLVVNMQPAQVEQREFQTRPARRSREHYARRSPREHSRPQAR